MTTQGSYSALRAADRRRLPGVAIVAGLALAAAAGLAGPRAVLPLFDGVVPIAPYVWLSPPSGEAGGAKGITDTIPVSGGGSPIVAVHTSEQPPQAQLVAGPGALDLPAGTTSLTVSLEPVAPAVAPSDGQVAGNVYRVSVTAQTGAAVAAKPGTEVTLTLRSPSNITPSWFEQFSSGSWHVLQSAQAGYPYTYETTGLTTFGDFALIAPGTGPSSSLLTGLGLVLAVAVGVLIVVGLGASVVVTLRRREKGHR